MSACAGEGDEPVMIPRNDVVEVGVEEIEAFARERQDQTLEDARNFEEAERRKQELREQLKNGLREDSALRQRLSEQNLSLSNSLLCEQARRAQLGRALQEHCKSIAELQRQVQETARETAHAYDAHMSLIQPHAQVTHRATMATVVTNVSFSPFKEEGEEVTQNHKVTKMLGVQMPVDTWCEGGVRELAACPRSAQKLQVGPVMGEAAQFRADSVGEERGRAREDEARQQAWAQKSLDAAAVDLMHLRKLLRERMCAISESSEQVDESVDGAVREVREMGCRMRGHMADREAELRVLTGTLIEREAAACQMREAMAALEAEVVCLRREVEDARVEAAEKCAALASERERERERESLLSHRQRRGIVCGNRWTPVDAQERPRRGRRRRRRKRRRSGRRQHPNVNAPKRKS